MAVGQNQDTLVGLHGVGAPSFDPFPYSVLLISPLVTDLNVEFYGRLLCSSLGLCFQRCLPACSSTWTAAGSLLSTAPPLRSWATLSITTSDASARPEVLGRGSSWSPCFCPSFCMESAG